MCRAGISIAALILGWAAVAEAQKEKLAVLPTQIEQNARGMVPDLFDDYLLTAVQNKTAYDVIGQDDINSMLGFEQQKELFGCDDVTCMADIGGALGVDRLVVVKIARLERDWVATSKLINIAQARVEARSSDFVAGDTKALLQAVPRIVGKLFGGGGDATPTSSDAFRATPVPPTQPPTVTELGPNPRYGRGARVWGIILAVTGYTFAGLGSILALAVLPEAGDYYDDNGDWCDPDAGNLYGDVAGSCEWHPSWGALIGLTFLYGGGTVLTGAGANLYLNGKARAASGDPRADGQYYLNWLGWTLTATAIIGPILATAVDSDALGYTTGIGGVVGAGFIWALTMASSAAVGVRTDGSRVPLASLTVYPDGKGGTMPGFALTYTF